jgi:hypothetical protein
MKRIFSIIRYIKELFSIECCVCKKKYRVEDMINWYGFSYVCMNCFEGKSKNKIKTRRGKNEVRHGEKG